MMRLTLLALAALLVIGEARAVGIDLTKIPRTLTKQPVYQSKSPKYCLLAFGPKAERHVWLVIDGGVLYIDRNGNGDLTEPNERIVGKGIPGVGYFFEAGSLQDGTLTHTNLKVGAGLLAALDTADAPSYLRKLVKENPLAAGFTVTIEVAMAGRRGSGTGGRVQQWACGLDAEGLLQFADTPAKAPIIHFGGPWCMALFGKQTLRLGRTEDMIVGFGTPGLGPGTFAFTYYDDLVPEKVFPVVEISFPGKALADKPVQARYSLQDRC
jgi:hypothetical protein